MLSELVHKYSKSPIIFGINVFLNLLASIYMMIFYLKGYKYASIDNNLRIIYLLVPARHWLLMIPFGILVLKYTGDTFWNDPDITFCDDFYFIYWIYFYPFLVVKNLLDNPKEALKIRKYYHWQNKNCFFEYRWIFIHMKATFFLLIIYLINKTEFSLRKLLSGYSIILLYIWILLLILIGLDFIILLTCSLIFKKARLLGYENLQEWQEANKLGFRNKKEWDKARQLGFETKSEWEETKTAGFETKSEWENYKKARFDTKSEWEEAKKLGYETKSEWEEAKKLGYGTKSQWEEAKKLGFCNKEQYEQAKNLGAKNYGQYNLTKSLQTPDYQTALLVQEGEFPDYETYQEAMKVGAKNYEQYTLVQKLQTPDYQTALLVQEGEFPDYKTYQTAKKFKAKTFQQYELVVYLNTNTYQSALKKAMKFGTKTLNQYKVVEKTQAPNYQIALEVLEGGFPDYPTYQDILLDVGATNLAQYKLVKELQAPDYITVLKIQQGGFSDYPTYQKAQALGATNIEEYRRLAIDNLEFPCGVCNSKIVEGENYVLCPHCERPFHYGHLIEWVNSKPKCPICKKRITAGMITDQIMKR